MSNRASKKQAAIIIWSDGEIERMLPILSGQLEEIGKRLIDSSKHIMVPPSVPVPEAISNDSEPEPEQA